MKWFKHDSRARNDAKLAKVIMKFGIEGYGLYFACLEIIAEELTPENFNFELEHDAELLAAMFKIDTIRVEKIMKYFIELGLFELSETTHRVSCYKLAKRLDNATSQNVEVRSILRNFKELKETSSDLKLLEADKIRLDKTREEKSILPDNFSETCKMARKAICKIQLSATDLEVIKSWKYPPEEIKKACELTKDRGGKSISYIDSILRSESDKKIKEPEFLHPSHRPAPDPMAPEVKP